MTELDKRREIANRFIGGRGFEIGAGLTPSMFRGIDELIVIDKRNAEQFREHFGKAPPYEIVTLEAARVRFPGGLDFLMAHHVLEHCANPIAELAQAWLPLIRDGGLLFLSMPSNQSPPEQGRLPTPIEHVIDDWAFGRNDDSFESRNHIPTFVLGWTVFRPGDFWYAQGSVADYAKTILSEINRSGHDLHWHSYGLPMARQLIEIAFHAAGFGMRWLHQEELPESLFLVARREGHAGAEPDALRQYRTRLLHALDKIGPSRVATE